MRVLALILLVSCGTSLRDAEQHSHGLTDGLRYDIRVDGALTRMWVQTCFDGQPPDRLHPMNSRAIDLLVEAYGGQGQELRVDDEGVIDLERLATGECVRYEIDLERAGWSRHAVRRGDDLMLTQALFMWRPYEWDPAIRIAVEFDVPDDVLLRALPGSLAWMGAFDEAGALVATARAIGDPGPRIPRRRKRRASIAARPEAASLRPPGPARRSGGRPATRPAQQGSWRPCAARGSS